MKHNTDGDIFEWAVCVFIDSINSLLEDYVLRARESPHAKRWWSKDLTLLQRDYAFKRNSAITLYGPG